MRFFESYTNESCYWAGFIAADGCIRKDRPQIHINLKRSDISHLRKLATLLAGRVFETNNGCSKFYMSDAREHIKDLSEKFNITALKSMTLRPPSLTEEQHIISFIRGYVDGDGCIYKGAKNQEWSLEITSGSKDLLEWIKTQITQYVSESGSPNIGPDKNAFRLRYCGRQTQFILDWLYGSSQSNCRLDRKYEKGLLACSL